MSKKNNAKNNTNNVNTNTATVNNSNVEANLIALAIRNNPNYAAKDVATLVQDIIDQKVEVLTDDQAAIGIEAEILDINEAKVTYTNGQSVIATIDYAPVFVGRKLAVKIGAGAAQAQKNQNSAKPQPQAKTFGKGKQNNQPKQATGSAAQTATATAQTAELTDLEKSLMTIVSGLGKIFSAKEEIDKADKSEKKGKKVKVLTKEDYEELLIREFLRINKPRDLEDGIKNIRVPKTTKDGSHWNVVDRTRMVWTLQRVEDKSMMVDISVMDLQIMAEEWERN